MNNSHTASSVKMPACTRRGNKGHQKPRDEKPTRKLSLSLSPPRAPSPPGSPRGNVPTAPWRSLKSVARDFSAQRKHPSRLCVSSLGFRGEGRASPEPTPRLPSLSSRDNRVPAPRVPPARAACGEPGAAAGATAPTGRLAAFPRAPRGQSCLCLQQASVPRGRCAGRGRMSAETLWAKGSIAAPRPPKHREVAFPFLPLPFRLSLPG